MRSRAQPIAGPTPVDAITYSDKRANLPTADAHDFVAPEIEGPFIFRYPRPLNSPQLVWRGKEEQDLADYLEGYAPPIYIQEKIDPRVIIEDLRHTAERAGEEPVPSLFDSFDGLPELDLVDFYRYQANWSNRMILGDSLSVMASLAEREQLRGKVQMIYIDPPYGIDFRSNWQVSARKRDVTDGRREDTTREVEQIKAFRDTWEKGINSYLTYLRDRLTVARELLAETGTILVQIGDDNVHLVRLLMDEVFGCEGFVAQIPFKTASGSTSDLLAGTVDYLLWYAKDRKRAKFRRLYRPRRIGEGGDNTYTLLERPDGSRVRLGRADLASYRPADGRLYRLQLLTSQSQGRDKGDGAASWFPVEVAGRTYRPSMHARWKTNEVGMQRLIAAGRVEASGDTINYVRFHEDFPVVQLDNRWDDTQSGSAMDKVYAVQTNTRVVERCMLMCTDPGDLVLDPTCGAGTTALVAEQWGRRWITIDTSRVALALARQRIMGARFAWYLLADSPEGRAKEVELTGQPLPRVDTRGKVEHGFVYERVRHVTLRSIATNPDIREGMSRRELDAAIHRHADHVLLYDKPVEDKRKVRVAGPFTVESLSPHRSVAFAGSAVDGTGATTCDDAGGALGSEALFGQTIIANLRTAGIQNGRRSERLTFDVVEPYASPYIQAMGIRESAVDGAPRRVGITIGPQYGTVGPRFIKDAAREANQTRDLDMLCVLAFAFDPAVLATDADYVTVTDGFASVAAERRLGRVPVLLVRMNADLVMGEELKKTGAGNLFMVFGEPDIEIKRVAGEVRVVLHGVDVYDPNTGELRTSGTNQIALWMIDTSYSGDSFFVRHCYFTGGRDPYKRLRNALKADIDAAAWESLYRTESRPFPCPDSGRIAVKVINDYGDEVMKVFTL